MIEIRSRSSSAVLSWPLDGSLAECTAVAQGQRRNLS
jgi:hypothetical protein